MTMRILQHILFFYILFMAIFIPLVLYIFWRVNLSWAWLISNLHEIWDLFLNVYWAQESKEWIPPAYVAGRAGTITLFLLGAKPP